MMPTSIIEMPDETQLSQEEVWIANLHPSQVINAPGFLLPLLLAGGVVYGARLVNDWGAHLKAILEPLIELPITGASLELWVMGLAWGVLFIPPLAHALGLLTTTYEINSRRLLYHHGIFNRSHDQIEMARLRDITVLKPFWLRLFGVGHIVLHTVDRTHPIFVLKGIKDPRMAKEVLHKLSISERARIEYREFEAT